MSLFNQSEVNRIKRLLGYPSNDPLFKAVDIQLTAIIDADRKTQIIALADELDVIDTKISEFTLKNYILEVGELTLDYSRVINTLKADANRKLQYLAVLCELDIKFNKFTGSSGGGSNPWSVRSLC